jgi:primase-polymerase (primpol)-like protein
MTADAEIRTAAMVFNLDARRKPQTFNGNLANLPAALLPLTKRKRWVIWRWELRQTKKGDRKWSKPPYQASDSNVLAASDDPSTWGTYAQAVAAHKAGKADGIGFVLGPDCPIGAFDPDACRDITTNDIKPWA